MAPDMFCGLILSALSLFVVKLFGLAARPVDLARGLLLLVGAMVMDLDLAGLDGIGVSVGFFLRADLSLIRDLPEPTEPSSVDLFRRLGLFGSLGCPF